MKKKKFNSFLALLLAATMAFSQPASAYAAELATEPAEVSESVEETEEAVTEAETEELTTGETETEEAVTEEVSTEETATEEATTEESTTEETATEEVTTEESTTEETVTEETVTEEVETEEESVEQKTEEELGFKPMTLSSAMIEEKVELSQVVTAMSSMTASEDYVENQVIFFAETEDEAKQIAECYGGTLVEYEYGVGIATIKATVKDAVNAAADTESGLPAVYPNIKYQISGEFETVEAEVTEGTPVEAIEKTEEKEEAAEPTGIQLPCEDEHLYATAPNDTYYAKQWHHDTMNTVEAWNEATGKGVTVAVIDTGVDYEHPDLKDNVVGHISTLTEVDSTGKVYFVESDGRDDNGHGTHCAGIIAATANNSTGVSGMAPNAEIYAVKALDAEGNGYTVDIVQGVISATAANVDVISMSLGSICYDGACQKAIDKAVNEKGIIVVAAAGNEETSQKSYPAAYNNVIAVAATSSKDQLTYFSNYGKWVDIAAPGYNILSTLPSNFKISDVSYEGSGTSYGYMSGTSMACPVVAGTVALMLESCDSSIRNRNDKSEVNSITKSLINSCDPYGAYSYWSDDPNWYYPLADAEACTYAVTNINVEAPTIKFCSDPTDRGVVLAGEEQYFELIPTTEHAKIYYTINGKKPTPKTGYLYTGKIYMPYSGKVKIQAVAVVGTKISKVFSKTYTFDVKAESLSSTCYDEMDVAIGKSIQLSVDFAPAYTSNQKLDWKIDGSEEFFTVNKKGKVTCKSDAEIGESAIVVAKTTDGTNLEYKFKVVAVKAAIDNMELNAESLDMSYWANNVTMVTAKNEQYVKTFQLKVTSNGTTTDQYLYKSSNTKVATVDADGTVHAIGKGKATITVTANDGSNKKAKCKVNVVTPIFDIYLYTNTGFEENFYSSYYDCYVPIAPGASVTIKSIVNEGSSLYWWVPSNKKVSYQVVNNAKVHVSKSGKVTCENDVTPGTVVEVKVTAQDGFGASQSIFFTVTDPVKKLVYVKNGTPTNYSNIKIESDEYGNPIEVGDAFVDLLNYVATDKEVARESIKYCPYYWAETSNRDVVYRYYHSWYGYIIAATKPGTSKVTYTIRDGSNKKFTVTFKVKEISATHY